MGLANKIKEYFGLGDEEYEDEYREEQQVRNHYREEQQVRSHYQQQRQAPPIEPFRQEREERKVIPFPHATVGGKEILIRLMEPRNFNEAQDIADYLCRNHATILNLRLVDQQTSKRILDFMSGVVYALNGDIQRVGEHAFICVPNSVDIEGLITD